MSAIDTFMTAEMVTAAPGESVAEVAKRMKGAGVGAVVLIDNDRISGLFSERDLLDRVVAEGRDPGATSVGEAATSDVITVTVGTSLKDCAETLKKNHIRHLPVVNGDKPVGIISARDFFEQVAIRMEDLIERVRYDEQLRESLDPYDHMGGSYGR